MKTKLLAFISGSILLLSACSKEDGQVATNNLPQQPYKTVDELLAASGISTTSTNKDFVNYVPGTYKTECIPNVAPSCCYAVGQICYITVYGGPVQNGGGNTKSESAKIVFNTLDYIDGQLTPAGQPPVFNGELEDPIVDMNTHQLLSGTFHISR